MNKLRTVFFLSAGLACFYWVSVQADSAPIATRFQSPQGKLDVVFQPIAAERARTTGARKEIHGAVRSQYRIEFWVKGSSEPVNLFDYMDADPLKPASDIFKTMLWSADEKYVVLPVMTNAQVGNHVFQDLVALDGSDRILEFEADHVRWVGVTRLLGDIKTAQIPGGVILADTQRREARLILAPLPGIGYQILGATGTLVTVKEFLNNLESSDKTSWESFTPACLILDIDSLHKRSVPCP